MGYCRSLRNCKSGEEVSAAKEIEKGTPNNKVRWGDAVNKKYQIFISSTYEDLKNARQKVQDAILSMYHFPVGMELFSAADEEQWEIIKETIDSTDYYVLIVGQRYGSVIQYGEDAGISYTEKEFRYAKEKGIPILAFIIDDSVPLTKDYIDTDVAKIEKLVAFKATVKDGRLVEWWKTPEELAQKVTTALYKQIDRRKRPGWIRSDEYDIEKSHAELLRLNERIRELEQENVKLKSQVVERKPVLDVEFILDSPIESDSAYKEIEEECCSHGNLLLRNDDYGLQFQLVAISAENYRNQFEPLTKADVFPELRALVSDDAIQKYNVSLPSKDAIDLYIKELEQYQRIHMGGIAFEIRLKNNGTAKATDVQVDFDFPDEFLLFEIPDVDDIGEPSIPPMPKNPITEAEREYARRIDPMADMVHKMAISMPKFNRISTLNASLIQAPHLSLTESIDVCDHTINLTNSQIQHYDVAWYRGIYIVPTAKGKYQVKCRIMCSEYLKPDVKYIQIEVI